MLMFDLIFVLAIEAEIHERLRYLPFLSLYIFITH